MPYGTISGVADQSLRYSEELAIKKGVKPVITMDKFSDLSKYDGQTAEKAIRPEIQTYSHIGYISPGSTQGVMLAMTRDSQRAFYRMGRIMELGPIERTEYPRFIIGWFNMGGYQLKYGSFDSVFDASRDVPYSIQRMCNVLWIG